MNSRHAGGVLRLVFAVVFAMAAFPTAAEAPPPLELTESNLASVLDPVMTAWIDGHKGPGAVVVVVTHDGPVFAKGYGFADVEAGKPFTADSTLVRAGSISKLFTGIAVMQLVDAGRLDLDRDVNDYIDFVVPVPQGGVAVTLRRLLTHRAGFEEHGKGLFSRSPDPEPLGRWLARNQPLRIFPDGEVEAYSNYGFALAGYVVERVSGEPFAAYVQHHILDPLGMSHSTFLQPLPDDLAPLMAKGYRRSDQPPQGFFETIAASPAGALSSTGTDMGRVMRALMNGGTLDGVRILSEARLGEMTAAPLEATSAGYLGLVFFGQKVAGHDTIGHGGATMSFFSDLKIFPAHGIGVFISRNGQGEIRSVKDLLEMPDPARVIAQRFLPEAPVAAGAGARTFPANASIAGNYHPTRRSESSFARLSEFRSQFVAKVDAAGNGRAFAAVWPFGEGIMFKRMGDNLYEGPGGNRVTFVDAGSDSYFVAPGGRLQRVPWWLDIRWIAPALAVSMVIAATSLVAWPIAALWRRRRKRRWSEDSGDQRRHLAVRLVLVADAAVIVALGVIVVKGGRDLTVFNDALDPLLLMIYALAWIGVCGAVLTVFFAALFWRAGAGSLWSRIHHTLLAAASLMLAWFFVTFHIAGTTLNY